MDHFDATDSCGAWEKIPCPWSMSHIYYNDKTCQNYTLSKEDPKI